MCRVSRQISHSTGNAYAVRKNATVEGEAIARRTRMAENEMQTTPARARGRVRRRGFNVAEVFQAPGTRRRRPAGIKLQMQVSWSLPPGAFRPALYSFSYGSPSAAGIWPRPTTPARMIIVAM